MFKKTRVAPKQGTTIHQFPHCDSRVLHAPGECEFCDHHADWQELRVAWGIAFTGWEPEGNELPCPSQQARSLETINKWNGNVPRPASV
jgi:hypothetical protein